jgi:hypothetical protein
MPAPGVSVLSDVQRVLRGAPTDTGVLFMAAPFSTGTLGVVHRLDSMADYAAKVGTRTGGATAAYDSAEVFFSEGGATIYAARVGPTSATASDVDTLAEALALFTKNLGPGQVVAPGDTTGHSALLAHARDNNRVALLNGGGAVTIGPVAGSTTNRDVPVEAFAAGLIARSDALRSVNEAPAADRGYLRAAIDVVTPAVADVTALATTAKGSPGAEFGALFTAGRFTDAERATLDEASVNPFVVGINGVQLYGFSGLPVDSFFTNARLRMSLTARLDSLAQQFVFRTINDELRGALRDVLLAELDREYKAGQLYGDTAEDAYDVDVSDAVNTPETIAAGRLIAHAWYVPGPFAERVEINILALPVPAATAV